MSKNEICKVTVFPNLWSLERVTALLSLRNDGMLRSVISLTLFTPYLKLLGLVLKHQTAHI